MPELVGRPFALGHSHGRCSCLWGVGGTGDLRHSITAPLVLMSQNRQTARGRDEAEHDYGVDRKALDVLKRLEEDQGRLKDLLESRVEC